MANADKFCLSLFSSQLEKEWGISKTKLSRGLEELTKYGYLVPDLDNLESNRWNFYSHPTEESIALSKRLLKNGQNFTILDGEIETKEEKKELFIYPKTNSKLAENVDSEEDEYSDLLDF